MKADPMHARKTGLPIGESLDDLPNTERVSKMAEGSERDDLRVHGLLDNDMDGVSFESDQLVASQTTEHLSHWNYNDWSIQCKCTALTLARRRPA